MDIRNFFKAAGGRSGGAGAGPPKKLKQDVKASQEAAPPAAPPAQQAAPSPARKAAATPSKRTTQSPGSSQGRAAGKAKAGKGGTAKAATPAAGSRKRKKKAADSDSDVEILDDDDSDEDFDAMSLDAEEDGDDDNEVISIDDDDSEEEQQPKPKRPKPSPASAAAAAAAVGGGAKGNGKQGGKATPAAAKGRGKKADKPTMVIEKTAGSADKKRKLPGSMAGQTASQAVAPKSAAKPKSKAAATLAALTDEARTAISQVEAAAAELPELDKDSLNFAPSGLFGGPMEERPPPNPGSKEVVNGHADAFTGKTFVFSGVLPSLFRDAAKDLVLSHGGRVTGDVSGKTSFLVVGDQCSRRKFLKAEEKNVKVIDEDGLLALAAASASAEQRQAAAAAAAAGGGQPTQAAAEPGAAAGSQQAAAAAAAAGALAGASGGQQQQQQQGGAAAGRAPGALSAMALHGSSGGAAAGPSRAAAAAAGTAAAAAGAPRAPTGGASLGDALWVEKYKPRSTSELVGNQTNVSTLRQWLHQWEDVNLKGATPVQARGGGYQARPKDMSKKAVLLSGPPGIGKTSSAHIIAKEEGYEVVEVNASDARGKSDNKASSGIAGKLSNVVREMVTSTALAVASGVKRKQLLVMDEVDGMSAGDRGGVQDLITTIKLSKIPIICICNDKYAQKLRSLRNHCLELDFRKPTAQQVSARMMQVCKNEGLDINDATLQTLAQGGQCDIRLVLGQLQMVRLRTNRLDYTAAKAMSAISKDADMSPFNACSRLFEPVRAGLTANPPSIMDRMEWVFSDADLVPLLVQENYVNYLPELTRDMAPHMSLRTLAKAADLISIGDVANASVRRANNWGLMPFGALVGSVMPSAYMRGQRVTFNEYEQNFTRFSSWFGNYSHGNKQKRLLAELSCAMAAGDTGATCSRNSVRCDYLPALRQVLTRPLSARGEEAIPEVIDTMQAYCINREQFDYVLDVTKFKTKAEWAEDPMKDVDTKTKSAFTRTFNKTGLKAKTAAMLPEVGKAKGKGRGKAAAAAAADEDEEMTEAVVGDAEGGAALAEEATAPATQRVRDEAEEEVLTPEQLAARMRQDGISLELKAAAGGGGGKSGGRGASGRGRGRGGRSGGGSGRSGGGRGRGGRGGK